MRVTETVRPDVYQEAELPERFGLSKRQAHRIAKQAGVKLGRVRLVTHSAILAYLEKHAGEVGMAGKDGK